MNSSQSKKVSAIIPNYNYGRFLSKRIDTIMQQTYPVSELIILDDASTDNSLDVIKKKIKEINSKYPNIVVKLINNDKNTGKAIKQWIKGVEAAEGDFIWIAEADDLSKPNFLKEVMQPFSDPDVVLSYSESMLINNLGLVFSPSFRWSRDKEKTGRYNASYVRSGNEEICDILAIRCSIPNVSAVVFRNTPYLVKALKKAVQFKQVGDWYLYLTILRHGKIAYNRLSLNKFRIHRGSVTRETDFAEHLAEIDEIYKMVNAEYDLPKKTREAILNERIRLEKKKEKIA